MPLKTAKENGPSAIEATHVSRMWLSAGSTSTKVDAGGKRTVSLVIASRTTQYWPALVYDAPTRDAVICSPTLIPLPRTRRGRFDSYENKEPLSRETDGCGSDDRSWSLRPPRFPVPRFFSTGESRAELFAFNFPSVSLNSARGCRLLITSIR